MSRFEKKLIFIFLFCNYVNGQHIINHYHAENGLISNTVYCSLSDQKGFLWFGSDKGVSKFDGTSFTHYTTDDGLTDNEILRLFEDSIGRIWFLTYNGIHCFYYKGKIYNPNNCSLLASISNGSFFTHVQEQSNELFFFKQYNRNYVRVSNSGSQNLSFADSSAFFCLINFKYKQGLITTKRLNNDQLNYSLWIFSDSLMKVESFNSQNQFLTFLSNGEEIFGALRTKQNGSELSWLKSSNFSHLLQQPINQIDIFEVYKLVDSKSTEKNLALITDQGILLYDLFSNFEQTILKGKYTTSITQDYYGGTWVTTKGEGIYQIKNNKNYFFSQVEKPVHILRENPFNKGEYWAASENKILRLRDTVHATEYSTAPFSGNERVSEIAFLSESELLIGNGTNLLYFDGNNFLPLASKSGIKQILIEEEIIYLAKSSELISQNKSQLFQPLNLNNQPYELLSNERTLSIHFLNDSILICGDNLGAFELNIYTKSKKQIPQVKERIKQIVIVENVSLFISDISGILFEKSGEYFHVNSTNGLISNTINTVVKGKKSEFWVATDKGISRINYDQKNIRNYTINDGLPENRINDILYISDTNLILATPSGIFQYKPQENLQHSAPKLYVNRIKINGVQKEISSTYYLTHSQNNIEISLTGIAFNDNLNYYYYINGDSTKWIGPFGNTLNFVNLPSGVNNIKLICRNKFGISSNSIQLLFILSPPFYETTLFWTILISFVFLFALLILILRQQRNTKKRKIALILSETKQKAFQAQLNPHFVFNALNSIQYLFMSKKEEEAQAYLSDFSILLRAILKHTDKSHITLQEELNNLKLYIELERRRIEHPFKFELEISDDVDLYQFQIPVMMMQPFVENSLWHAFVKIKENYLLKIKVKLSGDNRINILISDNGNGFNLTELEKPESKGIRLIKERIEAMNKVGLNQINFKIRSSENGTDVNFEFPIKF